ncbi:MAG: hypothetical protein ABFS34_16660, partial [Gemmatimonadota bacterium]
MSWKESGRNNAELRGILARVLRRWRSKRMMLGVMLVVVIGVASFAVATLAMPMLGSGAGAMIARLLAFAIPVLAAIWWIGRPAFRRIPEERIALYLEEHEPTLGSAVLGALAGDTGSRALAERAVGAALKRLHEVDDGDRIDRAELRRFAALLGLLLLTGVATVAFRPAILSTGADRFRGAGDPVVEGAEPAILIEPGDATIPAHGDVSVRAHLLNIDAPERVDLLAFVAGDSTPERVPMVRAEDGSYGALLFDLAEDTEYLVEADGVRSDAYTLSVAPLPYAGRVDVELVYPAYTGLATRVIRDARDLAAPRGTRARFLVEPTAPTPGGRILLDDGRSLPLAPADSAALAGEVPLDRDGFYRIELIGPAGDAVRASPEYSIDVLDDGLPTVRIEEPGRDTDATSIDEV